MALQLREGQISSPPRSVQEDRAGGVGGGLQFLQPSGNVDTGIRVAGKMLRFYTLAAARMRLRSMRAWPLEEQVFPFDGADVPKLREIYVY